MILKYTNPCQHYFASADNQRHKSHVILLIGGGGKLLSFPNA